MEEKLPEEQWYIVTTYSGNENKAKENIERRIVSYNLEDYVKDIVVAEEEVAVIDKETGLQKTKKNKKPGEMEPQFKIKNLFPGYVFVKMIMTDEAWYMVRNTPLVTGIAGSSGGGQKPSPVSYKEMERVLKRIGIVEDSMYSKYHVGDQVKIIHGAFVGMSCTIRSIDKENNTVQVEALFFGRKTLLDIDFKEIIKE